MAVCQGCVGRWTAVVISIIFQSVRTAAHIQLLYPLSLSPNDYLTSLHTSGLCGEQRTGFDYSYVWRNWPFLNKNTTDLQAGASTNITWSSAVDHVGGWRLELWNQNFSLAYSWDNQSHWGCAADGTARWANITMPTQACSNCTLRLLREAFDKGFGDNFTFASCAAVNVVEDGAPCNGCNGHGSCVQGSCQCDRSSSKGFWGGTNCEWEDECAADSDCGRYGKCVDMGESISYPPRFQCYCQNGYFGTAAVTASGRLPVRTCTRRSELTVSPDDARNWSSIYANQSLANPNNTYTLFWKVQNQSATPYIEYAIWANTTNWVGQGLRPTANRSQTNSQPTYTDVFPWLLPAPATTVVNNINYSGCPAQPNGAPVTSAAYDSGRLGSSPAPALNFTWKAVPQAVLNQTPHSSYLADGQVNWQIAESAGGQSQLYKPRPGFLLNDSSLNTTMGSGQCQAFETNFNDVAPMINQDMVVTTALTSGYYRMLDYFSPNLARPRPDVVYGGTDDILDASATEAAGVTYIKFRKPLFSNDSAGDYCLYPGINYQLIWAMGETTPNISKAPPGSVNINTASDRNFYKQDVLMYHGGGSDNRTDVASPFRGTLGDVDLFAPPLSLTQTQACTPSPLVGMSCSAIIIPNEYTIHWSPQAHGVNITAVASGKGFVGLGWTASPGQMLNSHAIIGWVNDNGSQNINVYELRAKTASGIVPANTFTPSTTMVGPIGLGTSSGPQQMLQFFRPYDSTFPQGTSLGMIASYHDSHNYLDHHTNRQPFTMDFSSTSQPFASTSTGSGPSSRLTVDAAKAHGICMWVAFAVIFPLGVVVARYFKDLGRRWYLVHALIQSCGIIIAIGSFVLAVTRFGAPPKHHYSIGVAAFTLMLAQPLTSIPRLCLHHGQVLRNPFFAWLHWTIGRGAIVFGWVNIFFGFGEYRRNFGLGSWPQVAFGLYLGALVLVCLVLESRLWHQSAARQRQREDDLSRRIAALSARTTKGISGRQSKALDSDEDDDLLMGVQPQQQGVDSLLSDAEEHLESIHVADPHAALQNSSRSADGLAQRLSHPHPAKEQ